MTGRLISMGVIFLSMAGLAHGRVRIWTADSLARLDPLHPMPSKKVVKLSAAQNEYEAFQIAVQAVDKPVTVTDLVVTDLTGEAGEKIAAKNLTSSN